MFHYNFSISLMVTHFPHSKLSCSHRQGVVFTVISSAAKSSVKRLRQFQSSHGQRLMETVIGFFEWRKTKRSGKSGRPKIASGIYRNDKQF
ncbi:hypothetical protein V1477_018649, partial [Vespula maculifrons]